MNQLPNIKLPRRCLDCDYILDNLTVPRCPECGRAFDPFKSETFNNAGKPFPGWARLLMRLPGIPTALLGLIPIAHAIWELRSPGGSFSAFVGSLFLWAVLGVYWLARLFICQGIQEHFKRPDVKTRRSWLAFFGLPLVFVLWIVLSEFEDFIQYRAFVWSENSLLSIATQQPKTMLPTTAGLLTVYRADAYDGGVMLMTGTGYDAWPYGYAYFPDHDPQSTDDIRFHHIKGKWWQYFDGSQPRYAPGTPPWVTPPTTSSSTSPTTVFSSQ